MLRKTTLLLALGASLALVGCEEDPLEPEFGIADEDFAAFDVDNNALLSPIEFETGFVDAGVFDTFDEDLSGIMEEDEFDADLGDFDDFDVNDDLGLDENEFVDGTFGAFDTSFDGFVDQTEFGIGLDLF